MKTIYLIRHGKASLEGPEDERGLTEEGIEHARQISSILIKMNPKINRVYSSPLKRAILTIELFAKEADLKLRIIDELKEKITGDTNGKNLNEEKRKMWEDFDSKLPGGESSNDATRRALSGLKKIRDDLKDGDVAAVQSHGTLIALILHHFDNSFGFDDWKKMTMPDIYKISYTNETASVEHIGCENIETFKIVD